MSSLTKTPSLAETFRQQSPRLVGRRVPIASTLISAGAMLLFVALVVQAFERRGVGVWSVGIAYILYDTALLGFTAWKIWPLRHALPVLARPTSRPTLGVIVAAHNEAGVLGITVDRLAAQRDPPDLILIADDGSDDGSAETLARLYGLTMPGLGEISVPAPGLPALRWLRLRHGGKARALNAAIQLVDTEIVLTVDADTLLAPGALAAMRDAFAREPALVAATGVLAPICGPHLSGRLFAWFQTYEYVRNFLSRYAWERLDSLLLISGAFAGFRREAVIAVGGFDPESMVEDYELIHRAPSPRRRRRARLDGARHRRRAASTDAPASPLAFLRQRRRWFGGFLQTQHWNRDMVGNRRFGPLGLAMLPVKALDTLQPIYGLTAFAILIVLIATGRFTLALPILLIMVAKIAIDLTFHLWSLGLYARWTGQREGLALGPALVAAIAEPFSFQLLRHAGAIWGWIAFLTGRETWARQRRTAIEAASR